MRLFAVLALAFGLSGATDAAELAVLAPVVEAGKPLTLATPAGGVAPVVTRVVEGELHARLQREAREGFTATMLRLDQAAQRIAGGEPAPTWLYLSAEDGGFARHGFWLREGEAQRYVDAPYVDLVVDADSLDDGSFEEIFAHELGHVFLRRLFPDLPYGHSRTAHAATAITDDPTAFDEGFGIHFQGLVRRYTRNPSLRAFDLGLGWTPFLSAWPSRADRALRIEGMRHNRFVHRQLAMGGAADALRRRDLSTVFDPTRLKNGNQMLAAEGVVATVFYRWLVAGEDTPEAVVARYTRLFETLAALNTQAQSPDAPLLIALIDTHRVRDPADGERLLRLFVATTYGTTIDAGIAARLARLNDAGLDGDIAAFVGELGAARKALSELTEAALADPAKLRAGLGPALWLRGEGTTAGQATAAQPLLVNLNTAEREHLLALPLPSIVVDRLLASRDAQGPYRSLGEAVARAGLDAAAAARLTAQAANAAELGTYPRH